MTNAIPKKAQFVYNDAVDFCRRFLPQNGENEMNRNRAFAFLSVALLMSACGEGSVVKEGTACGESERMCGDACADLSALHWSDCGVCAAGYEDRDGDAANGCESEKAPDAPECNESEKLCGDACADLSALHWSDCGTCAAGYEDRDGDAANGCESEKTPDAPECNESEKLCDGACADLSALHWSDCGTCAAGYEDRDGDAANGCESEKTPDAPECNESEKLCDGACADLSALHWSDCGTCAAGYEDRDGDAANGCESEKTPVEPECNEGEKLCAGACADLSALHWSDCGMCAAGYEDRDGDAANGCEAAVNVNDGTCIGNDDCAGLLHVQTAICVSGQCRIDACEQGYADCDANAATGCETASQSDFYRCGARGTCQDADETSANYKGKQCSLGDECRDGACRSVPEIVGCSDGTREGFLDLLKFNNLAACSGAWTVKGIHHNEGPSCGRKSGNTGENQTGNGCNVEDLCAEGWHVCLGRGDVATRSEYGCNGILDGMNQNLPYLFITRTSSTGNLNCDPDTVGVPLNMNDIFGCGNFGCFASGSKCDPLKLSGHNLCQALRESCGCSKGSNGKITCSSTSGECRGIDYAGNRVGYSLDYFSLLNNTTYAPAWDCGNDSTGHQEARDIVKTANEQGGVMCCKNQCETDEDCGSGLICRYNVCVACIINAGGKTEGCPSGMKCSSQHTCQ